MKRALSFLLILCFCVGVCATAISCDSQSTPKETETQAEQKPIETSTGTATEEKTESESVETTETAKVETTEESKVETTEESKVETTEESKVETTEESKVETTEESKVETTEESKVETTETTEETTEEVTEAAPANTVEKSKWESLFTADNLTLYYTDGSVSNFYSFDGGMLYIYSEYMGEGAGMYIEKAEVGYWFTEEVYFEGNWITSFDESDMLEAMYLARDIFFNALGNCYDSFTYDESSKAYLANNIQVGDGYEEFNLTDVCVKIENGKISTVNFKWEEFVVAINEVGTTSIAIPTVDFTVTEEEWDAIWSGDDFINVEIRYMEDYGSIIDRTVQNENTLINLLCTENAICANYDTYVIKKDGVWYEVVMSEDGYVGTAVTDEYVYENYLIYGTFSVDFLNAYNSFTYDEANECYVGEWCDQECRIYFANGKVAFVEVISAGGEKGAYMFCWYGQVTEEELYLPEFKIDGTDDEEETDPPVTTVEKSEWESLFLTDNLEIYYTNGGMSQLFRFDGNKLYAYIWLGDEGYAVYVYQEGDEYWRLQESYFEGNWIAYPDVSGSSAMILTLRDSFFYVFADKYDMFSYDGESQTYFANVIETSFTGQSGTLENVYVSIVDGKIAKITFTQDGDAVEISDVGNVKVELPVVDYTVSEEEWVDIWTGDDFDNAKVFDIDGYESLVERVVGDVHISTQIIYNENGIRADGDGYTLFYAKKDGVWYEISEVEGEYIGVAVTDEYIEENCSIYGTFGIEFVNNYSDFTYDEENKCYVQQLNGQEVRIYFANGKVAFIEWVLDGGYKCAYMFGWYGRVAEEDLDIPEFKIEDDEEESENESAENVRLTVTEEEWKEIFTGSHFDNYQMTYTYDWFEIVNSTIVGDYTPLLEWYATEHFIGVFLPDGSIYEETFAIKLDDTWYRAYFSNGQYIAIEKTEQQIRDHFDLIPTEFADYYSLFTFNEEKGCYTSEAGFDMYFKNGKLALMVTEYGDMRSARIFHNYGNVTTANLNIPAFTIADKGDMDAETWLDKTIYWQYGNVTMDYTVEFMSGYEEPVVSGNVKFTYNGCMHNDVLVDGEEEWELKDGMLNMVLIGCRERESFVYDSENGCYISIAPYVYSISYNDGKARVQLENVAITFDSDNNVASISADVYNVYTQGEYERSFEMHIYYEFSNYGTTVVE